MQAFSKPWGSVVRCVHTGANIWLFHLAVLCLIVFSPDPHGVQDRGQTFSQFGQAVLHPGRYFRIYCPLDQPFFLQIPKLGSQHFLGDTADGLLQFAESFGSGYQTAQDQDLPLVADQHECGLDRTGWQLFGFRHGLTSLQMYPCGNYDTKICLICV